MPPPTQQNREERPSRLLPTLALTGAALYLTAVDGPFDLQDLMIVTVAVGYLSALVLTVRYMLRRRHVDWRVAVTGRPGAGKTVFTNLIYDQLMRGNDSGATFTAESRSAIAVYQAIRGISADKWPAATVEGVVLRYEGQLFYGPRFIVDLEIGDSAGQHWLELVGTEAAETESYLEYVVSADGLVHVVSAEDLRNEGSQLLVRELADLQVASQLMRRIRGRQGLLGPLLLVISKIDHLDPGLEYSAEEVFRTLSGERFVDTITAGLLEAEDVALSNLVALVVELEKIFERVAITSTSYLAATGNARFMDHGTADVVRWIGDGAAVKSRRLNSWSRRLFFRSAA